MHQPEARKTTLLVRQLWLLAAFCGIFAARWPLPAVISLTLIILHQYCRIVSSGWRAAAFFLGGILLFFSLGLGYISWYSRPVPALPEWAEEAASPTRQHLILKQLLEEGGEKPQNIWEVADNRIWDDGLAPERDGAYRAGLRLRARVAGLEGRVDRSLRLILEDARLADAAEAPWPGRVVFTWYLPPTPEAFRPLPPGTPAYLKGDAYRMLYDSRPLPGDELELTLRLRQVRGLKNPGLWDIEPYWADQGVGLRAWEMGERPAARVIPGAGHFNAAARLREAWRKGVLAALPAAPAEEGGAEGSRALNPGAALIPALLFGDKFLMDSRDAELFARSTLAHSLALSGLHLGYAAGLGYFAVFLLYRLRPGLALRLPRRKAAVMGGAVPALAYLWLGGAPPSLLRAALMLAFVGFSLWRSRPLVLADALIWALAVILLCNPLAAFDLRLQLSALCLAALAWAQPLFSLLYRRFGGGRGSLPPWRRALRALVLLLASSAVIQVALAPLLVKSFGLWGLAMPLNALWLPVLGFVVMPCAFLGLLCVILDVSICADTLFYFATLPCDALMKLLRWLDSAGGLPALLPLRPHWASMLGFWFLLLLAPRLWAARHSAQALLRALPLAGLGLALTFGPLAQTNPDGLRLRLLDVGQGQAVLLEWGGKRMLIDGGGLSSPRFDVGKEVIAATLTDKRLPHLEYMLATHLDRDHAAGLIFPLKNIPVDYYADNGDGSSTPLAQEITKILVNKSIKRHTLRADDVLDLGGGLALEVLHPGLPRGAVPSDANRDSLVLRLFQKGLRPLEPGPGGQAHSPDRGLALICGDVSDSALRDVLRRRAGQGIDAEVLILAHHGSKSALLPEFYRAVSPRLTLAATGYGNYWNFPSPEVKNALLDQEVPLLSTAAAGQITLVWPDAGAPFQLGTARFGILKHE